MKTVFKDRMVHGIIVASLLLLIAIVIYVWGEWTIFLRQSTKFIKQIYFGDTITAIVRVSQKDEAKKTYWVI